MYFSGAFQTEALISTKFLIENQVIWPVLECSLF